MNTASVQAFLAVARCGSFSEAAEQLHLTQPAVTKRIQNLEADVGTPLFDRWAKHMNLTEAGRLLLPRAQQWLQDLEDMQRTIRAYVDDSDASLSGTLTVGTSHHIGLHRLPRALRLFHDRHPQIRLDLRFIDSEQAYDGVLSGELALGIVTLPPEPDRRLTSRVIWPDPLACVVSRKHPLAEAARQAGSVGIPAALLAQYPALLPAPHTFTRQIVAARFQQEGLNLSVAMETNYLETIKMMVSVGLGWSVLPTHVCDDEVIALPVQNIQLTRQLGVVYHPRRTHSRAAQALLQLLDEEVTE